MITLAITDLDGTLVDTSAANAAAYSKAFAEHGINVTEEDHLRIHGMHFNDFINLLAPQLSTEERDSIRQKKSLYYPDFFDTIVINTPLLELLQSLRATGTRIALSTTASKVNAERVLEYAGAKDLIEYFVFGESVTHPKPNPECFFMCMEWAMATPEKTIIFEDSHTGITAAHASGASVITISDSWVNVV
jgi:beta-phosphoglucomutase